MKLTRRNRKFVVGTKKKITLKDVGSLYLKNNENITIVNKNKKKEYDICKKSWGFYGTPSLNKRLTKFGYKAALVKNLKFNTYTILIVDTDKKYNFYKYLKSQSIFIVCWFDNKNLQNIEKFFKIKKQLYFNII